MLMFYVLVALGGAMGSVARAAGSIWMLRITGAGFPWGTIAINVLGSFVIGVLAILLGPGLRSEWAADARALLMIGVCGGFTTFSSFSLQTVELARQGRAAAALGNVVVSVVVCLVAIAAGMAGAAAFGRR